MHPLSATLPTSTKTQRRRSACNTQLPSALNVSDTLFTMDILRQYLFLIPIVVMVLCELTKALVDHLRTGEWHRSLFRTGGMPSSHSAFVTSLLIIVGRITGMKSVAFAIAFVFASVVWY